MAKTDRIIYQSESLFVSPHEPSSGTELNSTHIKEINRVQDMSYNLEISRTDINEFGQLAALSREVTEPPTVSLDFSYYLTDGTQEDNLGFNLNKFSKLPLANPDSFTKDLLGGTGDEKNFYIVTTKEGADVHHPTNNLNSADNGVIGIGNAFITSYGINAAVGELATASVSVEASNIVFKNNLSQTGDNRLLNPSVDVTSATGDRLTHRVDFSSVKSSDGDIKSNHTGNSIFALRPGDITIDFDAVGWLNGTKNAGDLGVGGARLPGAGKDALTANQTSVHIQSVSIDLPIGRSPLNRLGNHFAFARKVDFPVNMTLNASALMTDFTEGSLDDLMCDGEQKRDIAIIMRSQCGDSTPLVFVMRNAILDTQAFSASIGDNKTVDLTFSSQIGGSNDSDNGIFVLAEPGNPQVAEYQATPTPQPYATPTPD
jgi:hypothetical protein